MLGEFIENITKALVDDPGQVEIRETMTERLTIIEVHVAKQDVGKVIGRRGRTVQSMRNLLQAVSARTDRRAALEIVDA